MSPKKDHLLTAFLPFRKCGIKSQKYHLQHDIKSKTSLWAVAVLSSDGDL